MITFGQIHKLTCPDEWSEDGDEVVVKATCSLYIPHGDHEIVQHLETPGLWGIQVGEVLTDGDERYLEEVFEEERQTMLSMLAALGAKPRPS